MPAERSDDRLVRLLALVSYLEGTGPVSITDLATKFRVSERQIRADIDQLWVTGTPGYWPDDLIDFDADGFAHGVVRLTDARGLTRPLRLGTREAVALVTALRAVASSPAVAADAQRLGLVASALAKLTAAIGATAGEAAEGVAVHLEGDGAPEVVAEISAALTQGLRLRIEYVNAADTTSSRLVDPIRLLQQDGSDYLLAWCHQSKARRTFRLDRLLNVEVLTEAVDAVLVAQADADVDVARSAAGGCSDVTQEVTIAFTSPARWLAEAVMAEAVIELSEADGYPPGAFALRLRITDQAWLRSALLAWAPNILAVSPPEAATPAATEARQALANVVEVGSLRRNR
ncbi:MAG: WYL domain-containing protein [Promicromonosporaceae bacterium]|nr:WYL domain-containing protein [Promicromonosporaceae bacterium]